MARAVLVALIVVCSLVGTAAGGTPALQPSPPAQIDDDGGTNVEMLGLDSPTRSDVTTQGVDVSTAVSMQRESADAGIDRRALEVAFERAEDEQARRELLFEAATDVEIEISALRSEQRDRRSAYLNGTITPGDYTRSRATATVRAEQLRADLALIRELANRIPQFSMRSRLGTLDATLVAYNGPVSTRLQSTTRGGDDGTRVYLAVSENGSTFSMIDDDQYVRETVRSDLWSPDTVVTISFDDVIARVEELYPTFNTSQTGGGISTLDPDGTDLTAGGLYRINIRYDDRTTIAYLDGDTRNVFFEVQRVRLDSTEPGPPVSESANGTRLVVNRTYDGGPLRIATFDNTTGTPTDVPVFVDETEYRTGSDGVVWALDPEGRTRVVAVGESGNASVDAVPLRPSLINVSSGGG